MESYGGIILTGKTEELGEKSIPVSLFSPQTPQRDANPSLRGDRPPSAVSVGVTTSQAQGHKKEVEERNIK
jgi:hypothetical protein